jgi:heme exporter protein C
MSAPGGPANRSAWGIVLNVAAGLAMAFAFWMAIWHAPDAVGFVGAAARAQHIFYFHVSAAWIGFLAFFGTFLASIAFLKTRARKWDIIAMSSAEIGLLFTTMVVLTGPLWAKPTWGVYWVWSDPKLATAAVLWLIYLAYALLRRMVDEPARKARFSAVLGVIGFVDVPIVFGASRWWGQSVAHPIVVGGGGSLAPQMVQALMFSIAAFTLLYAALLRGRVSLERRRDELDELKQSLNQ